jgi:exosome complex component RRP42
MDTGISAVNEEVRKASTFVRPLLGEMSKVIVGVKFGTGTPFSDTPGEGTMMVEAEFTPLASPDFEAGPPGEDATELARVVDRGLRESESIDFKKFCITAGEKVWMINVDIHIINHDGNLIDASSLAALAALLNTKMFNYEVKEGEVKIKPGFKPLPIRNYPIAVTIAKFNDKLVVDPGLDEEEVMDARLTMTIEKDGKICAIQKGGFGHFTAEQVFEASKIAMQKAEEQRKLIVKE